MRRVDRLKAGGIVFHEGFEVGRDASLDELREPPRRAADRDRRLPARARSTAPGADARRRGRGARLSDRLQPQGLRRRGAGVRRRRARRGGQARRRGRRRRHRDGLRAHRGPPGRGIGRMPLSPRPRQHAGLAARSRPMPRKKASSSSGCPHPQAFGGDGHGRRACDRPRCGSARPTPAAAARPSPIRRGGVDVRTPTWSSRRSASMPRICRRLFGAPELGVTRWGTVLVDNADADDQPRRRVRRGRHRARREPGGLGDPRRPRRGGEHASLLKAKAASERIAA